MKTKALKFLDFYLRRPIFYDVLLAALVCLLLYYLGTGLKPKDNQENNILYLISVDASLSGFVIAALTILVTVKASSQYKSLDSLKTGIDFLFNSPLYKTLIEVFLWCIAEFVFVAFALFIINFYYSGAPSPLVNSLFMGALLMSLLTSIRTVSILASVVLVQAQLKPNQISGAE